MKRDKMLKLENTHYKVKKDVINYLLFTILFLFFAYGGMYGATGFSFGLEKVKAAETAAGYCHFKVEDETITGNSVVIAWYCTDGVEIKNYTFYKNDKKKTKIKKFDADSRHDKTDRLQISGFKPNTNYKIGFKTSGGEIGEVNFKTKGNGENIDKEDLKDTEIASPYVWTSDETSTSIKVHFRGFGTNYTSHTVYNDNNCDGKTTGEKKYNDTVVSGATQIGSFDILNLKSEQCYVIQLKFTNDEIVSKSYSTKTSSSGTNNSSGSISSNNDDNAYIDGSNPDGDWETEGSSGGESVKKDEIPQINKANNFICSESETITKNGTTRLTFKGLIRKYWGWVCILVPAALLVFISYDFVMAIISNDSDALKKSSNKAFKRTIAGLLILFVPWFVSLVMGWFGLTFCF